MKKLALLLTLLMILVSCFSCAGADTDAIDPAIKVKNKRLYVYDYEHPSDSTEIVWDDNPYLYFTEDTMLFMVNEDATHKAMFYLDSIPMTTEVESGGSASLYFKAGLYKWKGTSGSAAVTEFNFVTDTNDELLKITAIPDELTAKNVGSFRVRITGQNDLEFKIDHGNLSDVYKVVTGYYTINGETIPIVFGDSGTAVIDRDSNTLDVVANANGLKLLNLLPNSDKYTVSILFNPCVAKTSKVEYIVNDGLLYVFGPLHAEFKVKGGAVAPTAAPQSNVPATGDSAPIALFAVLGLLAMAGVAAMIIRSRKA